MEAIDPYKSIKRYHISPLDGDISDVSGSFYGDSDDSTYSDSTASTTEYIILENTQDDWIDNE